MDIGDMDVEDFQLAWKRARTAWAQASQCKLEAEASGRQLTGQEKTGWLAAKGLFEEYERLWGQVYQTGVVIMAGSDDEQDDSGLA